MNRRIALRNLGILTGGMVLLPSCDFSKENAKLTLNKLDILPSEQSLMKVLVDTIIPEGDIPGARSLDIDNFVWIMVDDCLKDEDQEQYLMGMKLFENYTKQVSNNSFSALNQNERDEVLIGILAIDLNEATDSDKALNLFVNITKNLTSYGYMQSEYIMKEVMPYTLIPGSYGPCETVDNTKRINVNG